MTMKTKAIRQVAIRLIIGGTLAGMVSACGHTTGDRALSGGLIGAGAGAVVGGIAGNPGAGALIGGAAGAVGGAATSSRDIDLGRPVWR